MALNRNARRSAALSVLGFTLSVLPGCSDFARETVERWRKKPASFVSVDAFLSRNEKRNASGGRRLAEQNAGAVCLRDRISAARLAGEIRALESAWTGTTPASAWFAAQGASFLQTEWLAGLPAECAASPVCAVQAIYERAYRESALPAPRGDEGLRIYHWALIHQSFLGCTTQVPGMKRFTNPLSDMLFSADQLAVFSEIAVRLPVAYRSMWPYRSLHRIPPQIDLGGIANASTGTFTRYTHTETDRAGKRKTRWSTEVTPGLIRFTDKGLRLSRREGKLTYDVSMRETVVHEMSHILDTVMAVPSGEMGRFSYSSTWLDLSGWRMQSSRSPQGLIVYDWAYDPAKVDQFVRWYGKESPVEDFADTASFYIIAPKQVEKIAGKRDLLKEWVFGGRDYSPAGLTEYYRAELEDALLGSLAETVQRCVSGPEPATDSPVKYLKALPASGARPARLERCLLSSFNSQVHEVVLRLRAEDWDACDTLKDDTLAGIVAAESRAWNSRISSLLVATDPLDTVARAKDWTARVSKELDIRELFVACRGSADAAACYDDRLERALADQAARAPAAARNFAGQLLAYWKHRSSFESARRQALQTVDRLVAALDQEVIARSTLLWKDCLSASQVADGSPSLEPFDGGARFVRSGILGCINSRIRDSIRALLVDKSRSEMKWESREALALAEDRVLLRYLFELDRLAGQQARVEEKQWMAAYQKATLGKKPPAADCVNASEKMLIQEFTESNSIKLGLDFSLRSQRLHEWALRFCGIEQTNRSMNEEIHGE